MSDIVEFLLARQSEIEAMYQLPEASVVRNTGGEVSARGDGWVNRDDCEICGASQFDGSESVTEDAWYEHVEQVHQRTWVLDTVKAHRAVIRMYVESSKITDHLGGARDQGTEGIVWAASEMARANVMLLANVHSEHPDFNPTWKVS